MTNIWQEIYKSSLKFLVPLDVKQTYMVIAKESLRLIGGGYVSIFLFDGVELKRVYTTSPELKTIIPRKDGLVYQVFRTRMPYLKNREDLISSNEKFSELPVQSNAIVPLNYGHLTFGTLSIISRKGKVLTEQDLRILSLFGPMATLAIRKTQLYQEAEKGVEARNFLISLAEHEIKNPLTAVLLNLEALKSSKNLKGLKEFKYIERLDKSTIALRHVVDEFLQLENIRFNDLNYNFCDEEIVSLCRNVTKDLSEQYTNHKFSFSNLSNKKQISIRCDREKIKQVLTNLINNAVKFSPHRSRVEVKLENQEGFVNISVSDQGVGIHKKDLGKVFKQYYRGRTQEKGMGLGLFLVKEIVKKHGGTVKIESEVDKGTKVSFILPL